VTSSRATRAGTCSGSLLRRTAASLWTMMPGPRCTRCGKLSGAHFILLLCAQDALLFWFRPCSGFATVLVSPVSWFCHLVAATGVRGKPWVPEQAGGYGPQRGRQLGPRYVVLA
jgi:hypothetical protein